MQLQQLPYLAQLIVHIDGSLHSTASHTAKKNLQSSWKFCGIYCIIVKERYASIKKTLISHINFIFFKGKN